MGVLSDILARKALELPALRQRRLPAPPPRRPVSLARSANADRLSLITEIKFRSPSAGKLSTALGVAERAAVYERSGASMLSVLCDSHFFDGEYEHLTQARAVTTVPLLCKEFVVDPAQLDAARAFGADAVLLIVRCLTAPQTRELVAGAKARDLVPFVEVTTVDELAVALDAGAELIGVNARDLDTLVMDAERAARVLAAIPEHVVRVHLSGLAKPSDVQRIVQSGADAALVGEALMRADDPAPLLGSLVAAARG
ncbi:MAG: Indole-3-glycerol phosphate synthase [Polyangiaceae bacterium]|jgi:indole-3-glycerol phosphate synthase|nr:Indole-3-glycerol phosphate synthase [Polyangiaceae bacterium]